ncbi:hypothetical protein M8445_17350 (plasmid) [Deinococcus aquaticus]|uniref:Uncharacterized protein n=1 Tax=Deinococcus aquaticus TaxID=328692 RepID=A0ABY7V6B0_9DEIO|nr:hypothetical protein [Deinococcus aquaticus]WDA60734.1 hypothetical protein M8445_17350 [Deinococcus aquaticus]
MNAAQPTEPAGNTTLAQWQEILEPILTDRESLHRRDDQIVIAFHDSFNHTPLEQLPDERLLIIQGPDADITAVASALYNVAARHRAMVAALLSPEFQDVRAEANTPVARMWFVVTAHIHAMHADLVAMRDQALRTQSRTRADALDDALRVISEHRNAARRFGPRPDTALPASAPRRTP